MTMSTLTPRSPAIEALRAEKNSDEDVRTVGQVRSIVDGLLSCDPLDAVAEAAGLSEDEVLALIAHFGTWLSHVRGSASADIVEAADVTDQIFLVNNVPGQVIIPPGFERSASHGRDVTRSLAIIVEANPDDKAIDRYISRQAPTTSVLTFPIVTSLVKFDELGRLEEIGEVSPSPTFRKRVVEAFDMLATAIGDANEAVSQIVPLTDTDDETVLANLDVLESAAAKLHWLQPREAAQLGKLVEYTRSNPAGAATLVSRLRTLRRLMMAEPAAWRIERIGDLNQGQVQAIARASGLSVEGVSRSEETEIRQRLTQLGLKSDADRLVPQGVYATLAGVADEFWAAMEARASGDPAWASILEDAYGEDAS